jgi:mannose-6-phosphate isomerase-like protein (cupin superfamily)
MPIQVFDYRRDLQNLAVRPEGRSRFRRVELGPVPPMHSHDLGAETFLVLEGQIEFNVEDESVVCQPGQLIVVPPRTRHALRAVGEQPGAIYLSVAPHVEPTHTYYDDRGECLPPRYGAWTEAGGEQPDAGRSVAQLLDAYRAANRRLQELLQSNANVAERDGVGVDVLWATLRPVLEQVRTLEAAWNELAFRAR